MLIPVLLYGEAGRKFGKRRVIDVASVADALGYLQRMVPGFRAWLEKHKDSNFRVIVGKTALGENDLASPVSSMECIKIVPVVAGAKDGFGQMIAGVVLIIAGSYFGQGWMVNMGVAMTLGGMAQVLADTPTGQFAAANGSNSDLETFSFSSPAMTVGQGGCVPLGYGRVRIGGHVISAGVDAQAWQDKGFGGSAPDNVGTRGGDGDTSPYVWAVAP